MSKATETTIYHILDDFREKATSSRDLGDKFEHLILAYLKTDPLYKQKFSQVWLWMDWPKRDDKPDTGIDLVAQEEDTGEYCAIQCKFFDPDHWLEKKDIDSFFTASGREPFSSRMIVSTTDKWTKNAEDAIKKQQIPVTRLRLQDLADSPIDWGEFSLKHPDRIQLKPKKTLRPHQQEALGEVMKGFKEQNRGKLIMACGTGKTFTSLKIAEQFASQKKNAYVLFLVPSIALLSQTLREWSAETEVSLHSITVCSDVKVGKKSDDKTDIDTQDLAFPATTNPEVIVQRAGTFADNYDLTVVFSTYQSIQAIADAQKKGLPEFDLIICDEAHRTTGVTLQGQDESYFVRVHQQEFIQARKRLYMTATPRLYGEGAKSKAQENDATLCSMDNKEIYGPEFHRLGFGEAVRRDLLTDYKVMVLAVDEKYVSRTFQYQLADENNELNLEDAVKITGCWNGLSKRMMTDANGEPIKGDINPMRRAVAFCSSIKDSKTITKLFSEIVEEYKRTNPNEDILSCELDHVDGKHNSLQRHQKLDWLKADTQEQGKVCRILSNARCLSEGVDVPALDAVMFLSPRNSVVDVVQSVGRVMRKAEGKEYGYIILPVGIPADMPPQEALKDNKRYKVVWKVLQALRSHDDRFNAIVNQIELNKQRPSKIDVIGVGGGDSEEEGGSDSSEPKVTQLQLNFPELEEWRDAIYAKLVLKCGDRQYWEEWAKDVAQIADGHISRIKALLGDSEARETFDKFLAGLHQNINPNVTEDEAIEMLSQHLITKPVFNALFEQYQFTEYNPVSVAMQKMLDTLEKQSLEKDTAKLEKFYASVRERASGIDNAEGKQKIITELYEKFFQAAFPRLSERLGIVYTPVEVVDFIINSANYALKQEFGVGLTDEGVHVLDPFTGTGTFIVRLLKSGLIKSEDLERKFQNELHANELVLLAYYIAAINIEETYHDLQGGDYQPFDGITLTDTFQMFENTGTLKEMMFPENNQRVNAQKEKSIRVIVANPPYSVGQNSENDSNKNLRYKQLDDRIRDTYAKYSSATLQNSLYDSYIRAIRWASDRIGDQGIVCYVTNGSFIDGNAADGLRQCLVDEFTSVYCFNLRGLRGKRTSGEKAKQEGGQIFGQGSGASIAITLLIKNPNKQKDNRVYYHDIGDYLKREEKLNKISEFGSVAGISWEKITPNQNYDWINQRDPAFDKFIPLGDKKNNGSKTIFDLHSGGVKTNRDTWVYNFSENQVSKNMSAMIEFYNEQVESYRNLKGNKPKIDNFINTDSTKIKWSGELKEDLGKLKFHNFYLNEIIKAIYRPFCKEFYYYDKDLNNRLYQFPKIFPNPDLENLVICVTGVGAGKGFSALIADTIPNLHFLDTSQCFPLYSYSKASDMGELFEGSAKSQYSRQENISDYILTDFQTNYSDSTISKEDIFYYVYGILHSPEYKERFQADLKKMLPRIPYAEDFGAFSKAGRDLAYWHINYEAIDPYPVTEYTEELFLEEEDYRVKKMEFGKCNKQVDKTTIVYNSKIKLMDIPLEAYDYIVNGKSALEWVMERYKFTKDRDSGITNDPNDWSEDRRYVIDLVKKVVRVSVETMTIVNSLPPLNELTDTHNQTKY